MKQIAVLVDPAWTYIDQIKPAVVIDGILAKENMGTTIDEAPLVIGFGPGFDTGMHISLSKQIEATILERSSCLVLLKKNSGVPRDISGFNRERVLRSSENSVFNSEFQTGMTVKPADIIGTVNNKRVFAEIPGVLRGLIRPGLIVKEGTKIEDIDLRSNVNYCNTIFDEVRVISGSVLEAVLRSVIN